MKFLVLLLLVLPLIGFSQFGRKTTPPTLLKIVENLSAPNSNTVLIAYGPNNRVLEMTEYIKTPAGEWIEWNKLTYTYSSDGNVSKVILTGVSTEKMALSKIKKVLGVVSSNSIQRRQEELNQLEQMSIIKWAVKPQEYNYVYDSKGRIVIQNYLHDPNVRDVFDYNNANNIMHRVRQQREGSPIAGPFQTLYSDSIQYNQSGEMIQHIRFIPFYQSMMQRGDRLYKHDRFASFTTPFLLQGQPVIFNPFNIIHPTKTNNYLENGWEYEYGQNGLPFMLLAGLNDKQGIKYRFHYVKGEDYSWDDFVAKKLPSSAKYLDSLNSVEENRLRPYKIYPIPAEEYTYFRSLQGSGTNPSFIQSFAVEPGSFSIENFSELPFLVKVSGYKSFLLPPGKAALLKNSLLTDTSRLEVKYPPELYDAQFIEFQKNYRLFANDLDKATDQIAKGILKRDHAIVTQVIWKDAKGNITNVEYPDQVEQELRNAVIDLLVPLFAEAAKAERQANVKKLVENMDETEKIVAASNAQSNYNSYHFKFPTFTSDARKPRQRK